jgi:hypothetical protein
MRPSNREITAVDGGALYQNSAPRIILVRAAS